MMAGGREDRVDAHRRLAEGGQNFLQGTAGEVVLKEKGGQAGDAESLGRKGSGASP